MDTQKTKDKLEDIGHSLQYHQEEIDHHQLVIDGDLKKAKKLEAELAEKPKLRHGDYGTYNTEGATGNLSVYIDDVGQGCLHDTAVYNRINDTGCSYAMEPTDNGEFIVLGNIFDDLKAMAEPLKSLYYGSITCEMRQKELVLKIAETTHYVMANDVAGFIVDLRRLLHTAEQEQHGKEAGK